MNFSSIKDNFLDWTLRVLGHHASFEDFAAPLTPRDKPPIVSNWYVLERLKALPRLEDLQNLQAKQMGIKAQTDADKRLKVFCRCAGDYQIQALDILNHLAYSLASLDRERLAQPFVSYGYLIQATLATRLAHCAWELSIDEEAFFKAHPVPRAVRHEYLSYLLRVVLLISALTFPEDYQDSYVLSLWEFLARDDWKQQLVLDSEETYELSKKRARRARPGVIAPPQQYPARFMLQGQTSLIPCLMYNPGVYGHLLVPNAHCIRKGA